MANGRGALSDDKSILSCRSGKPVANFSPSHDRYSPLSKSDDFDGSRRRFGSVKNRRKIIITSNPKRIVGFRFYPFRTLNTRPRAINYTPVLLRVTIDEHGGYGASYRRTQQVGGTIRISIHVFPV